MKYPTKASYISAFVILSVIVLAYTIISWNGIRTKTFDEFTEWLNDESNKCISSRNISGVNITVKYCPPQYIALKDAQPGANAAVSIDGSSDVITFLMQVAPDQNATAEMRAASIMTEGVSDRTEYTERVMTTNFSMDQHISLYVDGRKYKPLLCLVENMYELSDSRTFIAVFGAEESATIHSGKEYIFEYDDRFFHIGKIQFPFQGEAMQAARRIKAIKI